MSEICSSTKYVRLKSSLFGVKIIDVPENEIKDRKTNSTLYITVDHKIAYKNKESLLESLSEVSYDDTSIYTNAIKPTLKAGKNGLILIMKGIWDILAGVIVIILLPWHLIKRLYQNKIQKNIGLFLKTEENLKKDTEK